MAIPIAIATVVALQGEVFARNSEGVYRELTLGDSIYHGDVVTPTGGGSVELSMTDGQTMILDEPLDVAMTTDMLEEQAVTAEEAVVDPNSVAALIAALERGDDLSQELEATAAGLDGGGGDEGHDFVRLARIIETTDPVTYNFGAPAVNETTFLLSDPVEEILPESQIIGPQVNDDGDQGIILDTSVYFSGGSSNITSYEAEGLPDFLAIDPNTGVISGTVAAYASDASDDDNNTQTYTVTVIATDENGNNVEETFDWTINNPAPIAENDGYGIDEDGVLVVSVADGVLNNDSDGGSDHDDLTVSLLSDVSNGSLSLNSDGSFTYTPNEGYHGPDGFTYTVDDGQGGTDTATVNITVNDINDDPTSTDIGAQSSDDGETITPVDVSGNFSDVDGTIVNYGITGLPEGLSINANTGVISGTVATDASDKTDNDDNTQDYSVTVTATDDDGAQVSESFTWTVNNPAPEAADDGYNVAEDGVLNVNAANGVLSNDADGSPDGDALTVSVLSDVSHGSLSLNANGSFSYTPTANYHGPDSFTYTVDDGQGGTDTATVNITVNDINDDPTSTDIGAQSSDDGETITPVDVSGNFSDVDGTIVNYGIIGLPEGLSINANTGVISGTVATDASDKTDNDDNTQDYSVTVTATDDDGAQVSESFTWTVNNPAPEAADDGYNVAEDGVLNVNAANGVLSNDADGSPDGDALTVSVLSDVSHGSLSLNANGSFSYTPTANYHGPDSFTYTVDDGQGGTDTATVSITVQSGHDAPEFISTGEAADPTIITTDTIAAGLGYSASVTEGDTAGSSVETVLALDTDGDNISYAITGGNDLDLFVIDSNTGEITLKETLDNGDLGVYTLTVTATSTEADNSNLSDTAEVKITVNDDNNSPELTVGAANEAVDEGNLATGTDTLFGENDALDEVTTGTFTVDSNSEAFVVSIEQGSESISFTSTEVAPGKSIVGPVGTLVIDSVTAVGDGSYTIGYTYTLTASVSHAGGAVTDDFTVNVTDSSGDQDGPETLSIAINNDAPRAIAPETAYLVNDPDSIYDTGTFALDVDGDVNDNVGADQSGSLTFYNGGSSATVDSGMTSGSAVIWLIGFGSTALVGTTDQSGLDSDQVVFTATLNGDGTYTVALEGQVDGGAGEFSVKDTGFTFEGGNDPYSYFVNSITGQGVLLTPMESGVSGGTTNTNANEGGVSAGNSIGLSEAMRIDFVENLTGDPSKNVNDADYGLLDNQDHEYTEHSLVNGASVLFTAISGGTSGVRIRAFDDDTDGSNNDGTFTVGDGDKDVITSIRIVNNSETLDIITDGDYLVGGNLFSVDFIDDAEALLEGDITNSGDVVVTGIVSDAEVVSFTSDGFNSIEYHSESGETFKTGGFGASTFTPGDQVTFGFDLELTDSDGDSVVISDGIQVHLSPDDHVILEGTTGNDLGLAAANDQATTILGYEGDDQLTGHSGNDILVGGLGVDTFVWELGHQGSEGSPAVDTVNDFSLLEGDVLDLQQLLQGETDATLTDYLNFTSDGVDTTVHISTDGGFTGGVYSSDAEDQTIILSGVDLVSGNTQEDVITLLGGNLLTD